MWGGRRMTNDFNPFDALKYMMLHQLHPDADLNEKTMLCAKCGTAISLRESLPLSYYDEDKKYCNVHICMKCFADYVPKKELCEREFIRRFLRGEI
jgi:ribosomal protein L40E